MELSQLFSQSDIITLHCPLTPENYHLINKQTIAQMKPHIMLINTSRGALIDTDAIITALKSSEIGALGLDVTNKNPHYSLKIDRVYFSKMIPLLV